MTSSRPVLAVASLLLLAAVAALANSEVQHTPAVLFLDDGNNGDGVADLTPQAFAAAIAALLASRIPYTDSTTSLQVDALLAPDIFKRPEAVIVAVVAGIDQETFEAILAPGERSSLHGTWRHLSISRAESTSQSNSSAVTSEGLIKALADLPDLAGSNARRKSLSCTSQQRCQGDCLQAFVEEWEESQRVANDAQNPQVGSPDLIDLMQETDQEYVSELSCFHKSAEDEVLRATTSSTSITTPQPVLLSGLITTLQALRKKHGTESTKYQRAAKLVIDVLVHSFRSLRTAYEGQVVGALVLIGSIEDEEASLLKNSAQLIRVARKLQDSSLSSVRSRKFVNKTIAILTGLILFVAALLGVYALLYMPLTRDPLLYSGAKVD
eukprot:SM000010S04248  [mRNA]  locus=s10:585670:588642:+ [translate_table: standard]